VFASASFCLLESVCVRALGFGIEVLADNQKSAWRSLPTSKGRYIDVGLWRYSRHPNYFGEWTLWAGQFVLCASSWAWAAGGDQGGAFPGAGWLCVLSPLFVYFLLNHVSGVPLLEKKADERWGGEAAYQAYKRETWVFFLLPAWRTAASLASMGSIDAEGAGTYVSPTPQTASVEST
jgi:steroid 5-alpha reductase family enzyme